LILFTLTGRVVPKARPRVAYGHGYLPKNYRSWKSEAVRQLALQYGGLPPISAAQISVELGGKHRGDADNILGSILDAMVQSAILTDDRLSVINKLTIEYFPDRELVTVIKVDTTAG
jgi:Holliday junction resolvase RusA-like endonuclease